jgi:hypothetical protein
MSDLINGKKYHYWVRATKEIIEEFILMGDAFFFQYHGKDNFIEHGWTGYLPKIPKST